MKRSLASLAFLLWMGLVITVFYVARKPDLYYLGGLAGTLWTILVTALHLFNSYGIGKGILKLARFDGADSTDRLFFSFGAGLGGLGLLGLLFSALQLANMSLLTIFQLGMGGFFIFTKNPRELLSDIKEIKTAGTMSLEQYGIFTKLAILLPVLYSFLLTLTPPFEAFDALSYHLALPERLLQLGGLHAMDVPAFWYPNSTDYTYLWSLAMHSERSAGMLHFAWGVLAVLLLWRWAGKVWGMEIGRKTLLLIASLASLPLVSSWAYADMALIYYAVAALYAMSSYKRTGETSWLRITGLMAGFAMSVKYTSVTVPVACSLLLLFERPFDKAIRSAFQFGLAAILVAMPWYIRNALVMHNPFYPFLFGGLYWDAFRDQWYSNAGTGIGWDLIQILLIPFNMIIGHRELSPIDGRIGPLFLLLLPFTLWILLKRPGRDPAGSWSLKTIGFFAALSFVAWTLGVINSRILWQVRFFFPALIPLAIPTALGWDHVSKLDTSGLKIGYLFNIVIGVVITMTLIDTALFVLQRNPLAVALGIQSRERYVERVNPSYAALIRIMDELSEDASIYSLYEPRSYNFPRPTQPDLVLYNFAHDLDRYQSTDNVIQHWKSSGYTNILIYERGLDITFSSDITKEATARLHVLAEIRSNLKLVGQTPDEVYSIYEIP